jgi:hypothetical protein
VYAHLDATDQTRLLRRVGVTATHLQQLGVGDDKVMPNNLQQSAVARYSTPGTVAGARTVGRVDGRYPRMAAGRREVCFLQIAVRAVAAQV